MTESSPAKASPTAKISFWNETSKYFALKNIKWGKIKKTFQVLFHTLETPFIKGFVLKKANESPPESIDFQTFAMVVPEGLEPPLSTL